MYFFHFNIIKLVDIVYTCNLHILQLWCNSTYKIILQLLSNNIAIDNEDFKNKSQPRLDATGI